MNQEYQSSSAKLSARRRIDCPFYGESSSQLNWHLPLLKVVIVSWYNEFVEMQDNLRLGNGPNLGHESVSSIVPRRLMLARGMPRFIPVASNL